MRLRTVWRGADRGKVVVLLHGLFGSAANLGLLQRSLAQGMRTVAMDLRNHGGSPHAFQTSYPLMAGDVLETLMEEGVMEPVAVLGHSMGGKVAMDMALSRPTAVSRLLVADIAPVSYPPHFRTYAEAMRALPLDKPLTRGEADRLLEPVVKDPAVRLFLLQNLLPGDAPRWRIGLDAIVAHLPAIEGWNSSSRSYNGPTLFLTGGRSDYVHAEDRSTILAYFPQAVFTEIRDAGHWLHAEKPVETAARARDFMLATD